MDHRTDQPDQQPTPGDIYVTAARADHRTHCTACRERAEEAAARYAAYGVSIRRRDRITLGFRTARTTAVTG